MRSIINTLHGLTERGVTVRSLHDGVDTSTASAASELHPSFVTVTFQR
jgi:DNA invertase Pin-like site-specific DNA recombinase